MSLRRVCSTLIEAILRNKSLWVVVLGIVLISPQSLFLSHQVIGEEFNLIDGSWYFDIPHRLLYGQIVGRDFIFTYGPLFQLTHAAGLIFPSQNIGSLFRFVGVLDVWAGLLCVWALLCLTNAPLRWRAIGFFLWAVLSTVGIINGTLIKPLVPALLLSVCAVSLVSLPSVIQPQQGLRPTILLWILAPVVTTLYAFDQGLLYLCSLAILSATVTVFLPNLRKQLFIGLGGTVVGTLIIFVLLPLIPGWGNYIQDSLAIVSGYNATMAIGMEWRGWFAIGLSALSCIAILRISVSKLDRIDFCKPADGAHQTAHTRQLLLIIGLACFALVNLRSATVRSDFWHVMLAVIPTLLLFGFIIPCYGRTRQWQWPQHATSWGVALIILALGSPPSNLNVSERVLDLWIHGSSVFQLRSSQSHLVVEHHTLRAALAAIQNQPREMLYVWPWETIVNVLSNRPSPAYTTQSYSAHTRDLELSTVRKLEESSTNQVMMFQDVGLDGVENLSRTPVIFRYLLENFQLAAQPNGEFFLLERRPRQSWKETPLFEGNVPLDFPQGITLPISTSGGGSTCYVSDFLILRLQADSDLLSSLAKPGVLSLTFEFSDGKKRRQKLAILSDGQPHEILVCAMTMPDPLFATKFSPHKIWRANERLQSLKIEWQPLDILSRRPKRILLTGVTLLRHPGEENDRVIRQSWQMQRSIPVWTKFYGQLAKMNQGSRRTQNAIIDSP